MNKYPHVLHAFYNHPAAILPEKLAEIQAFLERKAFDAGLTADNHGPAAVARPREAAGARTSGSVGILPLFGVLAQRMNLLLAVSGGTSTELFGRALDDLVADKSVKSIVIVADSPGGSVFGVEELGRKILAARQEKRIVAIADSMAASAAYWIAAQASELIVTPGGMVGSVGVIAVHRDESKAEELAGIKTTLITAGEFKAETDPSRPLSSEGAAYLQKTVDEYYGMFLAALARGRGVSPAKVQKDFGQGRMVLAKEAVDRGMADKVATLDQVLHKLDPTRHNAPAIVKALAEYRTVTAAEAQRRARLVQIDQDLEQDQAALKQSPDHARSRAAGQYVPSAKPTREEIQRRAEQVAKETAGDRPRSGF